MKLQFMKILRDLLSNKGKSFLVVLSIAVGVIGVGVIGHTKYTIEKGMNDSISKSSPPNGTILTNGFDPKLVDKIKSIVGVTKIETRGIYDGQIKVKSKGKDKRHKLQLTVQDFNQTKTLDNITPNKGNWPPENGEILLERISLGYLNIKIGDEVWVETSNGQVSKLQVAGTVQHRGKETTTLSKTSYGYINKETSENLNISEYNVILFKTKNNKEKTVLKTAEKIRDAIVKNGYYVQSTIIHDVNKHWGFDIVNSMSKVLQSIGILTLILGASLVVNTTLSIMRNQIPQIGIMKVLGASNQNLFMIYIGYIISYGLIALFVGVPISLFLAKFLTSNSTELLNFESIGLPFSWKIFFLQLIVGVGLPVLSATIPVLNGIRMTVQQALKSQDMNEYPQNRLTSVLLKIRIFSIPFLLTVRSTFKKWFRLFLTVLTLSLGGAIVISVITVYESMNSTLEASLKYNHYDVRIAVSGIHDREQTRELAAVSGVKKVESWQAATGSIIRQDGLTGTEVKIAKPVAGTDLMEPKIIKGRWFENQNKNEIVLDSYILNSEPHLRVGDKMTININGKEYDWKIVGFVRKVAGEVVHFVNHAPFVDEKIGNLSFVHLITNSNEKSVQNRIAKKVKNKFIENHFSVHHSITTKEIKEIQETRANVVILFLIFMSIIMSVVATLGLMGSLSLNVMERSKEIAIMKLIGASDSNLWRMMMLEAFIIGLISFLIGTLLAYPISIMLSNNVGQSLFHANLDYTFSSLGIVIWFIIVLILSLIASFSPAYKATKIPVNQILSYE
ncbi:FtsX-like permease family protein [Bacillus sp. 31A1R]|uniref:FtsX-like permease family protein n=1 Tax=Robertmurraya mangrovi TaxID=3098077 RepID=A0ABU5J0K1_9BACI|nr:FtsX-like permease family protein [Bacillus sp. 31A1R]MDZ5472932.1 FtsX-like permease family protein [Bacillus sp. 31A1R]